MRMARRGVVGLVGVVGAWLVMVAGAAAQIPMERVLKRVAVPSEGGTRGLVDVVGFPSTAAQMTAIGEMCERLEREEIAANQRRYALTGDTRLVAGWCPHDDYMLAARVYAHVQRYIKARTVILVGNAHWSETFGVRSHLIFDDFQQWRGPYGPVRVSAVRDEIVRKLPAALVTVNRKLAETEHSLEALVPYLQYYNRDVEIVPILIPMMPWTDIQSIGRALATAVAEVLIARRWKLGEDVAVLVSGDGQHYGDYGWSYYDYHPFGCDADGYKSALALDERLVSDYLAGPLTGERLRGVFAELVNQEDISKYRITWCGRFAVPFGLNFARLLGESVGHAGLTGYPLRYGSSLALPWLPLGDMQLGLTGDANLHHFVTYAAVGFK